MMKHAGSVMMFVGAVLLFLYPALWVYGKVSQAYLHQQWQQQPGAAGTGETTSTFGRLVIPRIWVDQIVLEGVGDTELAKGPGHFPGTALPGEGNCVIAGHLNVNGSPFRDLDKLRPGDQVLVQAGGHLATYQVTGSRIISPDDVAVLDQDGRNRVTLVTCMPGAKTRLVVVGKQIDFM